MEMLRWRLQEKKLLSGVGRRDVTTLSSTRQISSPIPFTLKGYQGQLANDPREFLGLGNVWFDFEILEASQVSFFCVSLVFEFKIVQFVNPRFSKKASPLQDDFKTLFP